MPKRGGYVQGGVCLGIPEGGGWVYQRGGEGVGIYTPQTWDLGYPPLA